MFTGLVQAVGEVRGVERRGVGGAGPVRLSVDPRGWSHRPARGDSIAVSGCCLTVVGSPKAGGTRGGAGGRPRRPGAGLLEFDVVQETLDKTRLGSLRVGEAVNLEHAATPSTLLGGHLVQGHVDGVGRVARVRRGDDWRVWIALPRGDDPRHVSGADLAACVVPKGSICVDGVSLTVAGVWAGSPGAAEAERRGGRGLTRMGTDRGTKGDGGAGERGFEVALIPTTLELTTLAGLSVGDPVNLEVDVIAKTVVGWMRLFGGAGAKAKSEKRKAKINPGPR